MIVDLLFALQGILVFLMTESLIFLVLSIMYVFGLSMMRGAFLSRSVGNLLSDTPVETVRAVSAGRSAVRGTVRAADPLPAPFTDEECVAAEWFVERYQQQNQGSTWQSLDRGRAMAPFTVIGDDGGELRVEPGDEATLYLADTEEDQVRVDADDSVPPRIRSFLDESPSIDPADEYSGPIPTLDPRKWFEGEHQTRRYATLQRPTEFTEGRPGGGFSSGDRVYRQKLLRDGDEVYVTGNVQPRGAERSPDNPENLVIQDGNADDAPWKDLFLIADRTVGEEAEFLDGSLWWYPLGALLTIVSLGGLLFDALDVVVTLASGIDLVGLVMATTVVAWVVAWAWLGWKIVFGEFV